MSERFKFISTIHLLFIRDNKILMLRRFNTGYEDGNYSVPAGHLDANETAIQAGVREAFEETGVKIQESDLKIIHVMNRKSNDERIDLFAECKNWKGEIKNMEPEKCDYLSWFDLNKLP